MTAPALRLLRLPDVISRVGLGRSAIYAAVAAGTFPAPAQLVPGGRSVAWAEHEVDAWIAARLAARPAVAAQEARG
jgi:prophage regulatory protein